jgi:serine protease DegQ
MWLSAASVFCGFGLGQVQNRPQIPSLDIYSQNTKAEESIWDRVRPSIGFLKRKGEAVGSGVFISADGYLVAHQISTTKQPDEVWTADGQKFALQFVGRDAPAQLDLLKTSTVPLNLIPIGIASLMDVKSGTILAVRAKDALQVELTDGETWGIDSRTQRAVPMQAVRYEQSAVMMGGSLLFSANGKLMGSIAATLSESLPASANGELTQKTLLDKAVQKVSGFSANALARNYGPQGLVVSYTPTWEVTSRAVAGFLSPSHKSEYALLGVFVKDRQGLPGVLITGLTPGSSAVQAGIRPGDILLQIDDVRLRSQIDFFRVTYRLVPESQITIQLQRGIEVQTLKMKVGKQINVAVGPKPSIGRIPALGRN